MNLYVLPAGPISTNAFLLTEPSRGEAVLIDAPGEVWPEVEKALAKDKCRLTELWITHGHWDHTQGGAAIVQATGAKVRAHAADKVLIETPEVMTFFLRSGIDVKPIFPDFWVKQGETFKALGLEVEVRHVPGHCPGNVLFYFPALKAAFVGDALFQGSIGRTDLPGGSFEQLEQSIKTQIYTLPDDTTVHPGHGESTTVGIEKTSNPHVQG